MKQWLIIGLSGLLLGIGYPQVRVLWEVVDERGANVVSPVFIRTDQEDNLYVAGLAWDREWDILLIKYASDGTPLWSQLYDGGSDVPYLYAGDGPSGMEVDPQGNIVLGGSSSPIRQGQRISESIILKYTLDGQPLWERHWQPSGGGITIDNAGNILTMSETIYSSYIRKWMPDGTLLWERIFQPRTSGYAQTDPQRSIWLSGGEYEVRVRRLSPEGAWLWDWFAPSSGWDLVSGLYVDSNSNAYVMAMYALNPDGRIGSYDLALWKLNPNGQVIWHARYSTPYHEWQYGWLDNQAFVVDELGNAVYAVVNVGGYCIGCNPIDRLLIKFRASDGQLEWAVPVQMPERVIQRGMAVRVDEQGRVYVLGNTVQWVDYDPDIGEIEKGYRFVLARFDRAGRQQGVYEHRVRFYPNNLQVRGQEMVVGGYKDGLHVVKMRAVAVRSEGDLNGDGCVEDRDLARILRRFGSNVSQADVNGDGVINEVDLRIVLENFGLGCGG